MKKLTIPDDLSIPDFLDAKKRKPDEKGNHVLVSAPDPEAEKRERLLSQLTPASRKRVEERLRTGRYQLHWLEDPTQVEFTEEQTRKLEERRLENQEKAREFFAEKKREKAAEPKMKKPVFGEGLRITVLKEVSFRKPNTKSSAIYAEMVAWVKKNPDKDAAALMNETRYHKGFYIEDLKRGNIKVDVK